MARMATFDWWSLWALHCYPAIFVASAFFDQGSGSAVYHSATALLLVYVATGQELADGIALRRVYHAVAGVAIAQLMVTLVGYTCCSFSPQWLAVDWCPDTKTLLRLIPSLMSIISSVCLSLFGAPSVAECSEPSLQFFVRKLEKGAIVMPHAALPAVSSTGRLPTVSIAGEVDLPSSDISVVGNPPRDVGESAVLGGSPADAMSELDIQSSCQTAAAARPTATVCAFILLFSSSDYNGFSIVYFSVLLGLVLAWAARLCGGNAKMAAFALRSLLMWTTALHLITPSLVMFMLASKIPQWLQIFLGVSNGEWLQLIQRLLAVALFIELRRPCNRSLPLHLLQSGIVTTKASSDDRTEYEASDSIASSQRQCDTNPISSDASSGANVHDVIVPFQGIVLMPLVSMILWPLCVWYGLPSIPLLLLGAFALCNPSQALPQKVLLLAMWYEALLLFFCFALGVCWDIMFGPGGLDFWAASLRLGNLLIVFVAYAPRLGFTVTVAILSMLLATLAIAARMSGWAAHDTYIALSSDTLKVVQRCLTIARGFTVCGILMLALAGSPSIEDSSLVQLGYLLWFLALLHISKRLPWTHVLDMVQGDVMLWRGLVLYSGIVAAACICWDCLAAPDVRTVGFMKLRGGESAGNDTDFYPNLLARPSLHLLISVLASVQVHAMTAFQEFSCRYHGRSESRGMRWLMRFGSFVQFVVMLIIVLMPPVSLDAFLFLLFFVCVVSVAQFTRRMTLLLVPIRFITSFAWILLPFRCAIALPAVHTWLDPLSNAPTSSSLRMVGHLLGITQANWLLQSQRRQYVVTVLLLLSICLEGTIEATVRNFQSHFEADPTPTLNSRKLFLLSIAERWSPSCLILAAYTLTMLIELDFLAILQLVVLVLLLFVGEYWSFTGAFFSICCNVLLIAQYLCQPFVDDEVLKKANIDYWGLRWSKRRVCCQLGLLVLAIVQRALFYRANKTLQSYAVGRSHLTGDYSGVGNSQSPIAIIMAYRVQIGAMTVVLVALLDGTLGSLLLMMSVGIFILSGNGARAIFPAIRAQFWLQFLGVCPALVLLWIFAARVGAPPSTSGGGPLSAQSFTTLNPPCPCPSQDSASCSKDCNEDWAKWVLLSSDSLPYFIALFIVSHLRRGERLFFKPEIGSNIDGAAPRDTRVLTTSCCVGLTEWLQNDEPQGSSCNALLEESIELPEANAQGLFEAQHPDGTAKSATPVPISIATFHDSITGEAAESGTNGTDLQIGTNSTDAVDARAEAIELDVVGSGAVVELRPSSNSSRFDLQTKSGETAGSATITRRHSFEVSLSGYSSHVPFGLLTYIYLGMALIWVMVLCVFFTETESNALVLGYLWLFVNHVSLLGHATLSSDPVKVLLWPVRCIGAYNFVVLLLALAFQCPGMPARGEDYKVLVRCLGLATENKSKQIGWFVDNGFGFLNWMIFCACMTLTCAIEHFQLTLKQNIREQRDTLRRRAGQYVRKLAYQLQDENSDWDTKRQVLLSRLERLIKHINDMRAFWEGRKQLSEEERQQEEERQIWATRIEGLCLKSGLGEGVVEDLLKEFEDTCPVTLIDPSVRMESTSQAKLKRRKSTFATPEERAEFIDRHCLAFLTETRRRERGEITPEELAKIRKQLLRECAQNQHRNIGWRRPSLPQIELDASAPRRRSSSGASQASAESTRDYFAQTLEQMLRERLDKAIDSTLFIRQRHVDPDQHREFETFRMLAIKAICSQARLLLVIASVLQFMYHRSLMAAVPVSVVTYSLMAFPHVPWPLWVLLEWVTTATVFLKLAFQFPIFCAQSPHFASSGKCEFDTFSSRQCNSILVKLTGFRKVYAPYSPSGESTTTTTTDALGSKQNCLETVSWINLLAIDSLVCILVLFNMLIAIYGGRFGCPREITEELDAYSSRSRHELTRSMLEQKEPTSLSSCLWDDFSKDLNLQTGHWLFDILKTTNLRRPAMDFYVLRFSISFMILGVVLMFYNNMTGRGRSFNDALSANYFEGSHVMWFIYFFTMIIVDRMLYTTYRNARFTYENPSAQPCDISEASGAASDDNDNDFDEDAEDAENGCQCCEKITHACEKMTQGCARAFDAVSAQLLQKVKLTIEIILCHTLMLFYFPDTPFSFSRILFYILYMTYLCVTSLQLSYDVHAMHGGLRLTHSTPLWKILLFRVYCVLPFLHELRVIADWTVSVSSLNPFMWLKLEDAQQGLFKTRLDMEYRASTPPAVPRPCSEKVMFGWGIVVGLVLVLVIPLLYFSTLNPTSYRNDFSYGDISISLEVRAKDNARIWSELLYQSQIGHSLKSDLFSTEDKREYLQNLSSQKHDLAANQHFCENLEKCSIQKVTLPEVPDRLWWASKIKRQNMAEDVVKPDYQVWLGTKMTLYMSEHNTQKLYHHENKNLSKATRANISKIFNSTSKEKYFVVDDAFDSDIYVVPDKKNARASSRNFFTVNLTLDTEIAAGDSSAVSYWTLYRVPNMTIASDYAVPNSSGAPESRVTVLGLYMGFVLAVANFLKAMFRDSSKRIVYEELESQSLLMELCDGIYLARMQGNLEIEYSLYHELIGIYRSPEMMTHVSKSRNLAISEPKAVKSSPSTRSRSSTARRRIEERIPKVPSNPTL